MNDDLLTTLTMHELEVTLGGAWSWSDFALGASYSLALGCYVTGNPFLCAAAVGTGGIGFFI